MACLKDLPPELIGLIVEFFFAGVPVDCDEGRFSRHARLGTHLFAILRICKDLVTPQQVQDAMLRNSIIHLDDAEDVENFDRFLQPGQRQLMRTLRLSRHFTHTVGLSVLHDRSDELFNSLSIIEMESDPDEAMFMVDHRSDIFVRFGEHTEHIKQYKDPTCMCGADHGPMQRIQGENTRTAKHIEQALRRSFFECSSRIAAGLCIYRFLFEESNTEDLRNIVERADQCNVEVRIYLNAAIMVNLGESYCGCEWNLHVRSFSPCWLTNANPEPFRKLDLVRKTICCG